LILEQLFGNVNRVDQDQPWLPRTEPDQDHVEAAARHFGAASWQHRAHQAFAGGRCPDCGAELEAGGRSKGHRRRCPSCRLWWGPQFGDDRGRPKPGSMIVRSRVLE
jgi:hypothetical protein